MKESIERLSQYVVSDIEKIRGNFLAEERIEREIMALNSLCNAENALKNKCQQDTSTCKDKSKNGYYDCPI